VRAEGRTASVPLNEVATRASPLENAKLNAAIAYTLNSLFYGECLRAQCAGAGPDVSLGLPRAQSICGRRARTPEHPVKKELVRDCVTYDTCVTMWCAQERVKEYFNKIKAATEKANGERGSYRTAARCRNGVSYPLSWSSYVHVRSFVPA
jgi:hypothetical protein